MPGERSCWLCQDFVVPGMSELLQSSIIVTVAKIHVASIEAGHLARLEMESSDEIHDQGCICGTEPGQHRPGCQCGNVWIAE